MNYLDEVQPPTVTTQDGVKLRDPLTGKWVVFKVNTTDPGQSREDWAKVKAAGRQMMDAFAAKIGRQPTQREAERGQVDPVVDTRSQLQKWDDQDWKPVIDVRLSPEEARAREFEALADAGREEAEVMKMEQADRLAYWARKEADKVADDQAKAAQEAKRLERLAPKLSILEDELQSEYTSTNSDEGYRNLLERTRRQVLEGDSPKTERQMFRQIDDIRSHRAQLNRELLEEKMRVLEAEVNSTYGELQTLSEGTDSDETSSEQE
jgi:hypothetical protein